MKEAGQRSIDENVSMLADNTDYQLRLSLVVTSRNDDHGGNALNRMQLFLSGFMEQAVRYNLESEIIIVEWNPCHDRPRLSQVLSWPSTPGPCAVRFIEVPLSIHRRFAHSDRLPLFQMIGKNVGIRRARGRFVLATNIDILFSNEMVRFFASDAMTSGHLYRVDRYDVPADIPQGVSIDKQLVHCHEHVMRIHGSDGTRILGNGHSTAVEVKRWIRNYLRPVKRWLRGEEPPLHTNACGDFTLMAREHWFEARGYPEFEMYSFLLDGLLCYAAHYGGASEVILDGPNRIYHIEHSVGSGWTPGIGGELLQKRLNDAGIPQLDPKQYATWTTEMAQQRKPIVFNTSEDWGLANEDLPETVINGGSHS